MALSLGQSGFVPGTFPGSSQEQPDQNVYVYVGAKKPLPQKNHNLDSRQLSEKLVKKRCAFQTLPQNLPMCECRGPSHTVNTPPGCLFFAKWVAGFPKESVKPRCWKMDNFSGGKS